MKALKKASKQLAEYYGKSINSLQEDIDFGALIFYRLETKKERKLLKLPEDSKYYIGLNCPSKKEK